MKKNILISTIARNREEKLENYYNQIQNFVQKFSNDFDFSISIYENDSDDSTKEVLKNLDYSIFKNKYLLCEDIGTEYYGSYPIAQRVINYAAARNKTISQEGIDLNDYDYLLIIEVDVEYDENFIEEILYMNDIRKENKEVPDIYSGVLLQNGIPYDTWAIRKHKEQKAGFLHFDGSPNSVHEYWSTANGVCIYNIKPFLEGLRFNSFSEYHKHHDCDTAVLCEDFRRMGYNKVYINHDLYLYHERPLVEGGVG